MSTYHRVFETTDMLLLGSSALFGLLSLAFLTHLLQVIFSQVSLFSEEANGLESELNNAQKETEHIQKRLDAERQNCQNLQYELDQVRKPVEALTEAIRDSTLARLEFLKLVMSDSELERRELPTSEDLRFFSGKALIGALAEIDGHTAEVERFIRLKVEDSGHRLRTVNGLLSLEQETGERRRQEILGFISQLFTWSEEVFSWRCLDSASYARKAHNHQTELLREAFRLVRVENLEPEMVSAMLEQYATPPALMEVVRNDGYDLAQDTRSALQIVLFALCKRPSDPEIQADFVSEVVYDQT